MTNNLHFPGLEGRHIEESSLGLYEKYLPLHEAKPLKSFVTQDDNQRLIDKADGREVEEQVESGKHYEQDYPKQYRPGFVQSSHVYTERHPDDSPAISAMNPLSTDTMAPVTESTLPGPERPASTTDTVSVDPDINQTVPNAAPSTQGVSGSGPNLPAPRGTTQVRMPRTLARRASRLFSSLPRLFGSNANTDSEIEFEMCE